VSTLSPADAYTIALRLRVDGWTAEVVGAMHGEGIRPILLKGPVIARWLYPDEPAARGYCDCDLLVGPEDGERARALLAALGFVVQPHPALAPDEHHARIFIRPADGANVDLHRRLHGMQAVADAQVWAAARQHVETMELGRVGVDVPDPVLRALTVALHPEPQDGPHSKPWRDLARALGRVDDAVWQASLELARELRIERELAARLRRLPAGAELADRLGVTAAGSAYYNVLGAVNAGRAPRGVLTIANLRALPAGSARRRYVISKLVPPAPEHPDDPTAGGREAAGTLISRALRIGALAIGFPRALWVYRRERNRRPRGSA
jgi:hypothetical protein